MLNPFVVPPGAARADTRTAAAADAAAFAAIDRLVGEFDAARAACRRTKPGAAGRPARESSPAARRNMPVGGGRKVEGGDRWH